MKILITGAGGMLGSDLVAALGSRYEVLGVGKKAAPHLNIPYRVCDLSVPGAAQQIINKERPEVVFHAAAMTEVDLCETHQKDALACNFEATRHVVEGSNHANALLLFFSTDFVFDGTKSGPYEEKDPPRPLCVYGSTKFLAERYIGIRSKHFFVLRTSWLFGSRGNNFPKKILKQAETGSAIPVVSDQTGTPTYTKDLAEAASQIMERGLQKEGGPRNQIYHLTNQGATSRYEVARFILQKRNLPDNLLAPISHEKLTAPAKRPKNSSLSNEKIARDFGIRLRSWQDAMEAYLQEEATLPIG